MKVGILTFIHTNNYGANLQCFALQEVLKQISPNVEVLDLYRPCDKGYIACDNDDIQFRSLYSFCSWRDYRSIINKKIFKLLSVFKKKKRASEKRNGFDAFHKQYITFSDKTYRNFTQLYNEFPSGEYTHLVVGSDQVWNYSTHFSKEPFFLTFDKQSKKISYAASLGHNSVPEVVAEKYSSWLDDFSAISVREDNAVTAISSITNNKVVQTLDPTLLLTKKEWMEKLSLEAGDTEGYVLVYMLSVSTPALLLAQAVADKLDCKVKVITSRPYYKQLKNVEFLRNENPKSFVELYSNAKFVVTNSFHGTAFAVNFNIPFVTVFNKGSRLNSRKTSLLKLLNLHEREIFEGDTFNVEALLNCNFEVTNAILEKERQKSMNFICESTK